MHKLKAGSDPGRFSLPSAPTTPLSSSAKADDPVFQRPQRMKRQAAAYWMPRLRGAWRLV